jgi:hypothetical protein
MVKALSGPKNICRGFFYKKKNPNFYLLKYIG